MLTVIILSFLTHRAYYAMQPVVPDDHMPGFRDIEIARLNRIVKQYNTNIPKLRNKHRYNMTLLELHKKCKTGEQSIAFLTQETEKSGTKLNAQLRDAMLTQADIDELKADKEKCRAELAADFAYEMAYQNPVARIPTMISFLAKNLTRTK